VETVTSPSDGSTTAHAAACRLVVVHPPAEGASNHWVVLTRKPLRLGRQGSVESFLAFDDSEMSRDHALVTYDDERSGYQITDLGSRNGLFVDGRRVEEHFLVDQAVIRAGRTLLLFEECESEATPWRSAPAALGPSRHAKKLHTEVITVAPSNVPVLIMGETGVGKELVAKAVHEASGRKGPFVAVNCGALLESVAESELFGHVAGAFTGADRASEGLFAAARGGTLFLDEIGEMPAALQPKLLRVLSNGELRPVGASQAIPVDVRVVAATNRDLEAAIEDRSFRADLYARLSGWVMKVPPLRARREDILPLAQRFLRRGKDMALSTDVAEALLAYRWPLNVRELQHVIAASKLRASGEDVLKLQHLPPSIGKLRAATYCAGASDAPEIPLSLLVPPDRTPSKDALETVIARFSGNVLRVAGYFGKDRRQIYRWAERHQLDLTSFRE
jgi:transcriptional regulator with GAF, ATPase, and Fis domain